MKRVDQTTFGHPGGNCFSACVASLLEIDLAEVPYFMDAPDWVAKLTTWLRPRGFWPLLCKYGPASDGGAWSPQGFYILGGKSSRGDHAVVAHGTEIVHDPHFSREGLLVREDCTMLVPVDPGAALSWSAADQKLLDEAAATLRHLSDDVPVGGGRVDLLRAVLRVTRARAEEDRFPDSRPGMDGAYDG